MLKALHCVIRRDLLLAFRRRSDVLTTLFFLIIVATLFPLGVGPEPALLRTIREPPAPEGLSAPPPPPLLDTPTRGFVPEPEGTRS